MKSIHFILISISLLTWSCSGGADKNSISSKMQRQLQNEPHPGQKLIAKHCYLCHANEAPSASRIGPPMTHVKDYYLTNYPTQEEFTEHLISFVQDPAEENSIMPGALEKFGLMPKQQFPLEALHQIADYLYNTDISKNESAANGIDSTNFNEVGLHIALSTKKVLGQNLMSAMQNEGPLHALEFCNVEALPLTDSMSRVHHVTIQRVSDKNRNPLNAASEKETEYIKGYQKEVDANKDVNPFVVADGNKSVFYYPIITNEMCLTCHGNPEPSLAGKIKQLYPSDLATGYSENQVRGIWKIVFTNVD